MLRRNLSFIAIGILATGCHASSAPQTTAVAPAATATDSHAASTDNSAAPTPTPAANAALAEFHPPFPGRTELFSPPRGGQTTVRRDEEHGDTIELKGFLNVDGPQVVLSIDGVLSPIPEGGEKYGVQVISINPPQAVLQRGRSRWTATLE